MAESEEAGFARPSVFFCTVLYILYTRVQAFSLRLRLSVGASLHHWFSSFWASTTSEANTPRDQCPESPGSLLYVQQAHCTCNPLGCFEAVPARKHNPSRAWQLASVFFQSFTSTSSAIVFHYSFDGTGLHSRSATTAPLGPFPTAVRDPKAIKI